MFPKGLLSSALLLFIRQTLCAAVPATNPRDVVYGRASGSLDNFIATESPIALQGVLNNIGSTGSKAPGASSGIVIASPSTSNPNCKYFNELLRCMPPAHNAQLRLEHACYSKLMQLLVLCIYETELTRDIDVACTI